MGLFSISLLLRVAATASKPLSNAQIQDLFLLPSRIGMYKSTYPPFLNYTVPRRVSVLKGALKAPMTATQQSIAMSHFPQTLGIGRRTRRLAEQLERVRRYGAYHRRLAALRPYGPAPPDRIPDELSDSITHLSQ